jgi:hypothetical protein
VRRAKIFQNRASLSILSRSSGTRLDSKPHKTQNEITQRNSIYQTSTCCVRNSTSILAKKPYKEIIELNELTDADRETLWLSVVQDKLNKQDAFENPASFDCFVDNLYKAVELDLIQLKRPLSVKTNKIGYALEAILTKSNEADGFAARAKNEFIEKFSKNSLNWLV